MLEGKKVAIKNYFLEILTAFILISGVCVFLIGLIVTGNKVKPTSNTTRVYPDLEIELEDGTRRFLFDVTDVSDDVDRLRFYSSHHIIHAYKNGEMIYEFAVDGGRWTSSPGSANHFIKIDDHDRKIVVEAIPVYPNVVGQEFVFEMGDCEIMVSEIIHKSLPKFVASILILVSSLGLCAYYFVLRARKMYNDEVLYLAFFSFFMGVWSINETEIGALIARNRIFDAIVPYICIMLIVPMFVMFMHKYLGLGDKYFHGMVICLCAVEFVGLNILHFTKVFEFKQSLYIMQGVLVIAALYLFFAVIIKIIRKQYSRRLQICVVGLGLFTLALVVDLYSYYRALGDADHFGRYVYLAFLMLLSWDIVRGNHEIINKGRRAKELEMFAITDSMTGVFNRNAYEKHIAAIENILDVNVVMVDLNDLKMTNDSYGHDAGDSYIIEVAEIINDVCSNYGNVYRTGGDEFCVIFGKLTEGTMDRIERSIRTRVLALNLHNNIDYRAEVSIGVSKYEQGDASIRNIIKRADARMYEDKKIQKMNRA